MRSVARSGLGLPPNTYIYKLAQCGSGLACIASSGDLSFFSKATLKQNNGQARRIHEDVTCLVAGSGPIVLTAGRDGNVKIWDHRTNKTEGGFEAVKGPNNVPMPLLSLTSNSSSTLAAGTELTDHEASIHIWDTRKGKEPVLKYVESHSDDITELQFWSSNLNYLLSGSTDGLVNIYDTQIVDEDEAIVQVFNHGTVHHAQFLNDRRDVCALSHDEVLSVYSFADKDEVPPTSFGDVRQELACEYVVDICVSTIDGVVIPTGKTSTSQEISLVHLKNHGSEWTLVKDEILVLPGAHGEDIVRSVYLDEDAAAVFTAGEDGTVQAWKSEEPGGEVSSNTATSINNKASNKKKGASHKRFQPY